MSSTAKTIKSITTSKYEVVMLQLENGSYRIASQRKTAKEPTLSDSFNDYSIATMVFDNKVQELDGH